MWTTFFLSASKSLLSKLKKQLIDGFEMFDMGNVPRILGMNTTRHRDEGAITISQKDYMRTWYIATVKGCNPAYTPKVGLELSLNQPEEVLLNKEDKRRY